MVFSSLFVCIENVKVTFCDLFRRSLKELYNLFSMCYNFFE